MTPEEARRLLDGTTPGPWLSDLDRNSDEPSGIYAVVAQGGGFSARLVAEEIGEEADTALIAAAPTLAAMIAGMHIEYRMEVRDQHGKWHHDMWTDDPARCVEPSFFGLKITARRIVHRYVTEPEEA